MPTSPTSNPGGIPEPPPGQGPGPFAQRLTKILRGLPKGEWNHGSPRSSSSRSQRGLGDASPRSDVKTGGADMPTKARSGTSRPSQPTLRIGRKLRSPSARRAGKPHVPTRGGIPRPPQGTGSWTVRSTSDESCEVPKEGMEPWSPSVRAAPDLRGQGDASPRSDIKTGGADAPRRRVEQRRLSSRVGGRSEAGLKVGGRDRPQSPSGGSRRGNTRRARPAASRRTATRSSAGGRRSR